jgi:putative ABC transport system permease protein
MFSTIYLRRELRGRIRQTIPVVLGLALAAGLIITVNGASRGVADAQRGVLHSLYGIGTDITVTTRESAAATGPASGSQVFRPGDKAARADFARVPPGLGVLDATAAASIRQLRGVADVAAGLSLIETKLTIPAANQQSSQLPLPTTFTVDGVDITHAGLGPYASRRLVSGRSLTVADGNAAVVDSRYAAANGLTTGSTVIIAKVRFTVVGVIDQPQGAGAADVYVPLARAQAAALLPGKADTIYVAAASAAYIPAVHDAIARLLPTATVTSSADLAQKVSGSLAAASSLATDLGRWVVIAVLLAAFALAALLTLAAVTRRIRELGTLKALGWRGKRIVAQIMAESAATGVVGAILGTALGLGGIALIDAIAPSLTATVAQNPGSAPPEGALITGGTVRKVQLSDSLHTVAVHLSAPVTASIILLAVAVAVSGAVIAGACAAWRASRLAPATALVQVT